MAHSAERAHMLSPFGMAEHRSKTLSIDEANIPNTLPMYCSCICASEASQRREAPGDRLATSSMPPAGKGASPEAEIIHVLGFISAILHIAQVLDYDHNICTFSGY